MVARLDAGKLTRPCAIAAFVLLIVPLASAAVDEGRELFSQYGAALEKQEAAAAQGDMESYNRLAEEANAALAKSRAAFEGANAPASNDAAVLRDYAEVLRKMGDDDRCAEAVHAALERGVEDAALWRIYGESLLAIGPTHFQDGVDALRHALSLDDSSADAAPAWFALGKYYVDNLMPAEAGKAFAAALKIDAGYVPARLGAAAVNVYDGDVAAAGDIIEAVGRGAQPYDVMFRALIRAALQDFDKNRRVFADTVENHYAYARLLYIASRLPEAISAAKRAAVLAGDRVDCWNFLGAIQLQAGDYPGGLVSYQSSLKVKPDQPELQQTVEQLQQAVAEAAKQQQQAPASGQAPLRGQGPLR